MPYSSMNGTLIPQYMLRITQEYFQPKIGRKIRIFSLGQKKKQPYKKRECKLTLVKLNEVNMTIPTLIICSPKYRKCPEDPILVTLMNMQPRYSQSNREITIPSSGTSPLAC